MSFCSILARHNSPQNSMKSPFEMHISIEASLVVLPGVRTQTHLEVNRRLPKTTDTRRGSCYDYITRR